MNTEVYVVDCIGSDSNFSWNVRIFDKDWQAYGYASGYNDAFKADGLKVRCIVTSFDSRKEAEEFYNLGV